MERGPRCAGSVPRAAGCRPRAASAFPLTVCGKRAGLGIHGRIRRMFRGAFQKCFMKRFRGRRQIPKPRIETKPSSSRESRHVHVDVVRRQSGYRPAGRRIRQYQPLAGALRDRCAALCRARAIFPGPRGLWGGRRGVAGLCGSGLRRRRAGCRLQRRLSASASERAGRDGQGERFRRTDRDHPRNDDMARQADRPRAARIGFA